MSRTARRPSFEASEPARNAAAAILQVMAGMTTPTQASAALGISVNRCPACGKLGVPRQDEDSPITHKEWSCSCGVRNEDVYRRCQRCGAMREVR